MSVRAACADAPVPPAAPDSRRIYYECEGEIMSDAALSALYQEMILDHYRRPRNKGRLERADVTVPMRNPLCGDEITLELALDSNDLADVRFTGQGCSISQASASMMTELVRGRSRREIEQLRDRFRSMVMGDAGAAADESLGKARSLSGVARYPARVKCALLGWNALEEALTLAAENAPVRRSGANSEGEGKGHGERTADIPESAEFPD